MNSNEKIFNSFIEEAKRDPKIIGFFLSGSRGKNRQTVHSDYDIDVIVKDNAIKSYRMKYKNKDEFPFSFFVFSLSEFRKHAEIGSQFDWDRPSYSYVKAIVDKTGEVQKLIDNKSKLPKNKIKKFVSGYLDAYINHIYRSLKCFRDENRVGTIMEASRSIHAFLDVIFANEGRHTPYYKYLEWELETHPLKKFPMKSHIIIKNILQILETGNIKAQQKLFKSVEKTFRKEGFGKVFDGWSSQQIKFIKNFRK